MIVKWSNLRIFLIFCSQHHLSSHEGALFFISGTHQRRRELANHKTRTKITSCFQTFGDSCAELAVNFFLLFKIMNILFRSRMLLSVCKYRSLFKQTDVFRCVSSLHKARGCCYLSSTSCQQQQWQHAASLRCHSDIKRLFSDSRETYNTGTIEEESEVMDSKSLNHSECCWFKLLKQIPEWGCFWVTTVLTAVHAW